tara:strand:- start:118 stop:324 length:207 start_codon:yes stop_codon:yes gene_type:complete
MNYWQGVQLEVFTKKLCKHIILYGFVPLLDRFFPAGFLYFFYHRGFIYGTYDAAIVLRQQPLRNCKEH